MKRGRMLDIIREILRKNGIRKAYLFGSFARKEKHYHDIDIAIKTPKGFSLLDLAHVENALEEKTKKRIDLGTMESMHPVIKKRAARELVTLI